MTLAKHREMTRSPKMQAFWCTRRTPSIQNPFLNSAAALRTVEAGKVQCSRCFSFKFTDHPGQVQNWFDEDLEYDARVKRWRSLLLQQADDAHLPDQTELQEIWRTGFWHDNETHRSLSAEKSECITASPVRSEARWSKTQESWIWCTLAG